MSEPCDRGRRLQHRYDTTLVLRDVDLTIEQGGIFGFLGHNGAGQTTAMNILTTLIAPTAGGTATICGYDVVTDRREATRLIGYLPADVRMYGHMTAAENLEFFAQLSGVPDARTAARETLEYLGSADLAKRRVGTFSTGMRQRIGIARAIVHRP